MQPVDVYADKSSMAALHICPEKQKNATEQMWLYTYTHTRTQRGDLPFFYSMKGSTYQWEEVYKTETHTKPAQSSHTCTHVKQGRTNTLTHTQRMYEGRNHTSPHSFREPTLEHSHTCVYAEDKHTLSRCNCRSERMQCRGTSPAFSTHSGCAQGWRWWKRSKLLQHVGGRGEAVSGHSGACSSSILGFFPPSCLPFFFFFLPCSRADSMSTGRVLNESNPISRTPYQLWTGLFLTADLSHRMPLKNPYPTTINTCWKHNAGERQG